MSEEDRYDYSDSICSLSDFSNDSMRQLVISDENFQEVTLMNNKTKEENKYLNLFDKINAMDGQESSLKSSQPLYSDKLQSELNPLMDEVVNNNLPNIFKDTTAFVFDDSTQQVWESMVLSGFYKSVVLYEIKKLMVKSEFDNEWSNEIPNITEEDKLIMYDLIKLPKSHQLSNLTQTQRTLVSNAYKILTESSFTYNKLLKYSIPPQIADVESEKKSIIGRKKEKVDKAEKIEIFKPPRIMYLNGYEYYYNTLTGIHNQNFNYRCRDYKWKGSIKLASVNPFGSIDIFKDHSECWSVKNNWDAFIIEKEDWELQTKFNLLVESIISKEKYTTSKADMIYSELKVKAHELSKKHGIEIFAPDREAFVHRLRQERESLNPKSYIDKVIFNNMFRNTWNQNRFLRSSNNILDKNNERQKVVMWMSDFQSNILSASQRIKIGIVNYKIPKWFKAWLIIMAYWNQRMQFLPWCICLVTSIKWEELYHLILKYLINQFKIFPSEITVPLNLFLFRAIKIWYPKARVVGCFKDLVVKILKKYIKLSSSPIKDFEEVNFWLFSKISKDCFRYSNINKSIEQIEDKIESHSQESNFDKIVSYLKKTLWKYSNLLDYQSLESVTLNQIEDFWMREVVYANENTEDSLVNFIKWIIRIENELHYSNSIKTDISMLCNEIEKEDVIDVTEISREYYNLYSWIHSKDELSSLSYFDYDTEFREIAKLQKEYSNQLLEWFHQNLMVKNANKRLKKEMSKQYYSKVENQCNFKPPIKTDCLKNEIDLTIPENQVKVRKEVTKQKWEILTIDD